MGSYHIAPLMRVVGIALLPWYLVQRSHTRQHCPHGFHKTLLPQEYLPPQTLPRRGVLDALRHKTTVLALRLRALHTKLRQEPVGAEQLRRRTQPCCGPIATPAVLPS